MLADGENALAERSHERRSMRRVQRIKGGASTTWQNVGTGAMAGLAVFGVGMILMIVFRPFRLTPFWDALFFGFLGLLGVSVYVLILAGAIAHLQNRREVKRGYTPNAYTNVNAAQIDPRTGVVIREPGEPLLTKAQRVEAVRRARAWAAGGGR